MARSLAPSRRWITRLDDLVLDAVTSARNGPLSAVLRVLNQVGSENAVRVIGWSTIVVLLLSRRFRHLLTYLAVLLVVVTASGSLAFALGRVYLGVDHPTDVLAGLSIGWAFSVIVYRLAVPEDVFPIRYRRTGNTAHLDLSGPRGSAVRRALEQQLGIVAVSVEPFGLEASAGSTPLRIRTADGRCLFA